MPIFYSPWLEFPLSNERKSRLPRRRPSARRGTRGFEFALPYYFNLAPNYDATVTPRIMTKRGLQIGGAVPLPVRHATMANAGEVDAEVAAGRPADRHDALGARRGGTTSRCRRGFAGYVNLNKVSDDTYFADLADRVAVTSQTTLPREAGLTCDVRAAGGARARADVPDAAGSRTRRSSRRTTACRRSSATLTETPTGSGSRWSGIGEYAHFRSPTLTPTGDRAVLYPQVAGVARARLVRSPRARGIARCGKYDLDDAALGGDRHARASSIPIASLDGGLVFERDWKLFGTQLRADARAARLSTSTSRSASQNQLPVFDTALDDFNFAQLFTENRYLGNDRIGDTNQLTLARDVAAARSGAPAPSGCASRSASASTSRTSG